uniref:ATP-binding protein n=1 Tax=Herbaspirillum lusitanum TaxID=213312 RepID=UPI000590EC7C
MPIFNANHYPYASRRSAVFANRGMAMTRQQMERMFDRFYRGDKSRSEFTESNGLGLAIVKAI